MLELRTYLELAPWAWSQFNEVPQWTHQKNFGGMPPNAKIWRAPRAATKKAHGAKWLNDGSRVQNRKTTSERPYDPESKRTERSPIEGARTGGLMITV
jgi:hypothetical protein